VFAGIALGLAFNVKLLEALIAVPALAVLYLLTCSRARRQKLVDLAAGAGALALVSVSWAIPASLAPGNTPWPVGSSDGSVWNAMFVFNGFAKASRTASTKPGGPGPFRLVVSTGWHYDLLFGCVLVAAVAIAAAATAKALGSWRRAPRRQGFALALAVWIALAVVVFDSMATLHSRYLEAVAPAIAAAIGYGAAVIAGLAGANARASLRATVAALACICAYTFGFKPSSIGWGASALVLAAIGAALVARAQVSERLATGAKWLLAGLIVGCALVFPVHETFSLVRTNADDSLGLATAPPANVAALSSFLWPRTMGIRYELAVDEPLALAALIIHDQRPILPLTSFGGRPLTSVDRLRAAVLSGSVRYGLVAAYGCGPRNLARAGCTAAALWIRERGVDVTPKVGLEGRSRLYLLTPQRAG
jgi:4-amino-4-deoxy-L-arabinose transferase-like glycosyltransferase